MSEWWEAAPLADQQTGGNWWEAAPLASPSPQRAFAGQEMRSASPSLSDRLSEATGWAPEYWRGVVESAKAPARFVQGATDLPGQVALGIPHAAKFVASAGGYAPNAVSEGIGSVASTADEAYLNRERERAQERLNAGADPNSDPVRMAGSFATPFIAGRAATPAVSGINIASTGAPASAVPANALSVIGEPANALGAIGTSGGFLPNLARATAVGAGLGYGQPIVNPSPDEDWSKTKGFQTAVGAGTGAALQGVSSTVGPWASEKAQQLIGRGVPLTIGETLGGPAKYIEDAATSTPILGAAIRRAQQRSSEGFSRTALDEVLSPIGQRIEKSTPIGREAIKEASDKIAQSYNAVVPQLQGNFDKQLMQDVATIRQTVPAEKIAAFDDAWQRAVMGKTQPGGNLSGRDLQAAESDLRKEAAGLMAAPGSSFYDKELGAKLFDVHGAIETMTGRYNAPELVQKFADTNLSFRMLKPVERAAATVGNEEGVVTAAQLANAIRATDKTANKGASARGEALMQNLADTGKSVMARKVPDSGTPARGLVAGGLYGAGFSTGTFIPMAATEVAAASAYLPPVQAALRSAAAGAPETRTALAKAIMEASPSLNIASLPGRTSDAKEQDRQDAEWRRKLRQSLMESK